MACYTHSFEFHVPLVFEVRLYLTSQHVYMFVNAGYIKMQTFGSKVVKLKRTRYTKSVPFVIPLAVIYRIFTICPYIVINLALNTLK